MKSYTITVNGNVYDVTVEENGAGSAPVAAPVRAAAPVAAPAAAPAPAASGGAGNVKIEAGAAGKVFSVDKKSGDAVKRGDTILVLEVMKMETPVVAPEDGTVASIDVTVGQSVEAGALLATMNN
ncbi:acetyl-CoA carboxylase biotin carboxyl carrier protein subunit [Lachnospiraceae bacterium]|nr:acetyl-CoA carboxylase biotin carboxyl carrier protein subunit [Lachnospiraceae bacterium]